MTTTNLTNLYTNFNHAAQATGKLLAQAQDLQWSTPPNHSRGEGRSQGTINDPTAATALNPSRLRLRSAVIAAEEAFKTATRELDDAYVALDEALTEWTG